MKALADILNSTPVSSLINAKPMAKKNLIYLHENDSIRTALITFTSQEIESIPIRKSTDNTADFIGMISLVNLLKFLFSTKEYLRIPALLNLELANVTKEAGLIQEIEFIAADSSLMHLLLNVWGKTCNPKTSHIDCRHLLTTTNQHNKYDVITPLDFLRHLLFLNSKALACMKDSLVSEIENGFDVDSEYIVSWSEDTKVAMERMIRSEPVYILAVVNEKTGSLEANVTFADLLPKDPELLEESVSMMRREGVSLQSYLQTLHSLHSPTASIDPILLYPHFSIYVLIEKLTRLRAHHLWRVTPDMIKKPIGAVGTVDVLRYLSFMFGPFMQEEKENNSCQACEKR